MATRAVPVTVVGGYLGAGKTTFVNHLLRHAAGRRLVVMVNDFGDTPIDAALIESRDGDTLALSNGCICCSMGADLVAAFDTAIRLAQRADSLVIEASGVAEPDRIADFARAEPDLALDSIVVLADARSHARHAADPLVGATLRRQVAAADLLLLNKTDLVEPAARDALARDLAAAAPRATLVATRHAAIPLDLVFGDGPGSAFACTTAASRAAGHEDLFDRWSGTGHVFADHAALGRALARLPVGLHRLKGYARLAADGSWWSVQTVAGRTDLAPCATPPALAAETSVFVAIWPRGTVAREALDAALRADAS
jgi:G3E family GTPase